MATQYPANLDSFENPAGDTSQAQARTHSQQHSDENDAIEALEAKVGIDESLDPASLDYKVRILRIGGWRSVETIDDRDSIPSGQLAIGMIVAVTSDLVAANNILWQLTGFDGNGKPVWRDMEAPTDAKLDALQVTVDSELQAMQDSVDKALEQVFDGSPVYADVATGLAAVADGVQFKVQSSDENIAYSVYQRVNASNATHITDVPAASVMATKANQSDVDDINQRLNPFERIGGEPPELVILDKNDRVLGEVTGNEVVSSEYERIEHPDTQTYPVIDRNNRVLAVIPRDVASAIVVERICEDGSPSPAVIDPTNRVIAYHGSNSKGTSDSKEDPGGFYFPERMRKFNLFRAGRGADNSVRLSFAVFGDSWVDGAEYWMRTLCKMLRNKFGDGGIGYADIGSYSVLRDDVMTRTIGSDWVLQDETVPGPAIYSRTCSVAGGAINYVVSNAPVLTGARLYWIGSTDGVIRYRWDSGDWTTLNVQGSGAQTADLTGYAAAGSYTLDIELVSGTAQLCGIDFQSADAGIVVHKLGNAGSRADDWLSVDATIWEGFITQLNFDSAAICLGTNDRYAGVSADLYASRISEMISRIRTALPDSASLPGPDIMSIVPSRVWRDTPLSMDEYKSAILNVADDLDIAVTELISAIGDPYTRRDWFDSNGVHPLPGSGGLVVASRLFCSLNS